MLVFRTRAVCVLVLAFAFLHPALLYAQNRAAEMDAYFALLERYAAGDYRGAADAVLALDFKTTDITQSRMLEGMLEQFRHRGLQP